MNMKLRNIKLLYSSPKSKINKIFTNSLSVNNIRQFKIKESNPINKYNSLFNSERITKTGILHGQKIKLPKIHFFKKIKNDIRSRLLDINNGKFFITDENKIHLNKNKIKKSNEKKTRNKNKEKSKSKDKNRSKSKGKEFQFNVDSYISKFDEEYIQGAIEKKIKQRNKLDKIYGITSDYINQINSAKKKKYLTLKDYQSNILNAYSFNEKNSDKSITLLSKKFDELREETESIVPFPKINIKNIINHIKNKRKTDKIFSVKSYINKINEPKDEYEKEEQLINSLRVKRKNFAKLRFRSMAYF